MRFLSIFLFVIFVLTLNGCYSTVRHQTTDVDILESHEQGYALIGIDSNTGFRELRLSGDNWVKFTKDDLRYGTKYLFVALPAGQYQIEKVSLNRLYYLKGFEEELWRFEVKPNTISYVGDFKLQTSWTSEVTMVFENHSVDAVKFLKKNYPKLLQSYQLRYGGSGDDLFWEYINKNKNLVVGGE